MAKYIQIPTTLAASPNILFNTDEIASVLYLTTTTFAVYAGTKSFTFTTSAAGATAIPLQITTRLTVAGLGRFSLRLLWPNMKTTRGVSPMDSLSFRRMKTIWIRRLQTRI